MEWCDLLVKRGGVSVGTVQAVQLEILWEAGQRSIGGEGSHMRLLDDGSLESPDVFVFNLCIRSRKGFWEGPPENQLWVDQGPARETLLRDLVLDFSCSGPLVYDGSSVLLERFRFSSM